MPFVDVLPVDFGKYSAFLVAMVFMAISPGPAILFCVRTGLSGRKASVVTGTIGLNAATLVWFAGSALGLQILMTAFPLAFHVLAIGGGLYVGWLGFSSIRGALNLKDEVIDPRFVAPAEPVTPLGALRQGFFVQILNPKVLLFFTAVLPPFVDTARAMPPQMGVFAATAVTIDMLAMNGYGLAAFSLSKVLRQPRNKQRFDIGAGAVLMLVSATILFHAANDLLMPSPGA